MIQRSEEEERLYGIPLKKALQLVQETRSLPSEAYDILDKVAADRLLIGELAGRDLEPSSFGLVKITPVALNYLLVELATRLVKALAQLDEAIQQDHQREVARFIVTHAREEGRLPQVTA